MSSMFCTKIYICKNKDWCARDFNPKSDKPKCFEPLTNADHIRAMTDEELAMIISCQDYKQGDDCFDASCYNCTLEWLKQEVKE